MRGIINCPVGIITGLTLWKGVVSHVLAMFCVLFLKRHRLAYQVLVPENVVKVLRLWTHCEKLVDRGVRWLESNRGHYYLQGL
jgi:hypothetical protein